MSLDVVASYESRGKSRMAAREFDTEITTLNGNMLKTKFKDWRDADVVFANSTCYDDELLEKISNIALGLKKGAFVITFTKRLPAADFDVLEYELHQQSWGAATVYIQQKTTEPRESEGEYLNGGEDEVDEDS